jgi:integrase
MERYVDCWRTLQMFIAEKKINSPAVFTRQHCFDFVDWRTAPNLARGKYCAGRNTALLDLKIMRLIMNEAVVRGFAIGNPCVKLQIGRAKNLIKPELTDDHIAIIRSEIAKIKNGDDREFFSNSFEIARYQGCRLRETLLNPLTQVDPKARRITFKAKGDREHVTRLHAALVPLFEQLRRDGRTETWKLPAGARRQWPRIKWYRFLQSIGLHQTTPGVCFHSLRVTAATRLARSQVLENLAQQFIGHASTTVHRLYQRLKPDDLADCESAIG